MWNKRNSKERNISKRNTTSPWIRFNYENRLGIQIWIFLHQVLDYHDVSMKHNCTWFYIAAVWYMLDVVAYICNYTYKFLDATLFMLDVQALGYSDTYRQIYLYSFMYKKLQLWDQLQKKIWGLTFLQKNVWKSSV